MHIINDFEKEIMKTENINFGEFKELLAGRRTQILKNLSANRRDIESFKNSNLSDDADHASLQASGDIESAISLKQKTELKELDYALFKIENKTYGVCEMCEEHIEVARLKVKPQAKYCIVCREILEKNLKKG